MVLRRTCGKLSLTSLQPILRDNRVKWVFFNDPRDMAKSNEYRCFTFERDDLSEILPPGCML
ncbi:hypothetical protein L581_4161 [Serratia fonticola AU-AP2C]|nr:hypothetical protein L581_4161 [Serratia fonticola AU-AP2C]